MSDTKKSKSKNSVRNRKKAEATAVQKFLPIAEIHDDAVILKNGGIRAVLSVSSLNFNLKSEDEQQAIIGSYQQFVNTLTFPLQIVVRSTKLNIDGYVSDIQKRADAQKSPLLKEQTQDYARFIDRLVDVADIMQKRFYVIVPIDPPGLKQVSFFQKYMGWLMPADTGEKARARKRQFEEMSNQLRDRLNLVKTGLENVGLPSERLNTAELIELFYQVYNPKTSQEQKLTDMTSVNAKEWVL